MFANQYFSKQGRYLPLTETPLHHDTSIVVMIPCLKEPDILLTLNSLYQCTLPNCRTEVIVLINEAEQCDATITKFNMDTFHELVNWSNTVNHDRLFFIPVKPVRLPQKWAGVGLARKRGMDEALFRFNGLNRPDGIIVSLDADTIVDQNYLVTIEEHFKQNPGHVGATISFSHQLDNLDEKQRQGIELYEKYLHYYKNALEYAGFPNAIFTIGSAFAVKADAYLRRGGMTRRKAGEDFYFLQTLTQLGKVGEITTTQVHPSGRVSVRVPFGTGPAMRDWMNGRVDLRFTYNLAAFTDLKEFFQRHTEFYQISPEGYQQVLETLPASVSGFLESDGFFEQVTQLSQNCSKQEVFSSRFFHLFNAFKILKYINYAHSQHYPRKTLAEAWEQLQQLRG